MLYLTNSISGNYIKISLSNKNISKLDIFGQKKRKAWKQFSSRIIMIFLPHEFEPNKFVDQKFVKQTLWIAKCSQDLKFQNKTKNAAKRSRQHARIQQRSSYGEGRLPLQLVFLHGLSSTEGGLPPKVIFHWRLSSTKGVFHRRSSSTEGRLPPKVVFHSP